MPVAVRSMSAPTAPRPKGAVFKEKTTFEAWCLDVGVRKVSQYILQWFWKNLIVLNRILRCCFLKSSGLSSDERYRDRRCLRWWMRPLHCVQPPRCKMDETLQKPNFQRRTQRWEVKSIMLEGLNFQLRKDFSLMTIANGFWVIMHVTPVLTNTCYINISFGVRVTILNWNL